MTAPSHRSEIYVGLFVLLGLGLLGWLIFHFGDSRGNRIGGTPLIVEVRDATGIRAGVPVRLGGVEIGRASGDPELNHDYTLLSIPLTIYPGSGVPTGSTVKIGTSGLMGDSFVRIIPPEVSSGEFLPPGHRILAEPSSSLNDLAGSAGDTLEEVTITAGEIRTTTDQIEALFHKLDKKFLTNENLENIAVLLAELRASSEYIHKASKKFDPLLDEAGSTLQEITTAAAAATTTLAGVDKGVVDLTDTLAAIDPVVSNFDQSIKDLSVTLQTANDLLNLIENGDGLASSLLHDSTLKSDLESFLDKLDRHGLLLYPREGGFLRDSLSSPSLLRPSPEREKRPFSGSTRQP